MNNIAIGKDKASTAPLKPVKLIKTVVAQASSKLANKERSKTTITKN